MNVLQMCGVEGRLLNAVYNFHDDSAASVKTDGEIGYRFPISVRVRQGRKLYVCFRHGRSVCSPHEQNIVM